MPRQDILAGLKNALARGDSLEKAKQSFINAGYNAKDVEVAAQQLSTGSINLPQQTSQLQTPPQQQTTQQTQTTPQQKQTTTLQQTQQTTQQTPIISQSKQTTQPIQAEQPANIPKLEEPIKKKSKKTLIIFLISLFVLIIILIVLGVIFKEKFIDFFNSLFGK